MKRFSKALLLGLCAYLGGISAVALTSGGLSRVWAQPASNAPDAAQGGLALREPSGQFQAVARKMAPCVVAKIGRAHV